MEQKMDVLQVRGLPLGAGRPKICASLVAKSPKEVWQAAPQLAECGADMAELRGDWLADVGDAQTPVKALQMLRSVVGQMPLLYTWRFSPKELKQEGFVSQYLQLCRAVAQSGAADLIDVEPLPLGQEGQELVCSLKPVLPVITSSHVYTDTPPHDALLDTLRALQATGGDIVKLAVMAQSEADTARLLAVTARFRQQSSVPLVAIGMGEKGRLSRLAPAEFASCLSFAALDTSAAPGQWPVQRLRKLFDVLYPEG